MASTTVKTNPKFWFALQSKLSPFDFLDREVAAVIIPLLIVDTRLEIVVGSEKSENLNKKLGICLHHY
jgi:hypothetical protein